MASQYYCSNVAGELETWSRKLHKLSSDFDRIPSIDKYKLQPQIDALHIFMTELDDRLCELVNSCSIADETGIETGEGQGVALNLAEGGENYFDYDFGG